MRPWRPSSASPFRGTSRVETRSRSCPAIREPQQGEDHMKRSTILGLLAATLLTAAPAAAQDKVTFRLNWIAYGFHTPFYLGVERGYYKDEGIDLTIGEGQGSVRAVQTVGAKGDTFGLADGGSVVAGVTKGAPVRAVMAVTNSSPYALSARTDSGIKTLKD